MDGPFTNLSTYTISFINQRIEKVKGTLDLEKERLKKFQENDSSLHSFDKYDQMLKDSNADCIIVTTPNGLHPEHSIRALESGFHVVTEKPMAIKWEDGKSMVKAAKQNDKKLFVVKQLRYLETLSKLKKAIKSGRFGKIYYCNANVFWNRNQEYYDQAKWRGTSEFDGGAFMNQASHFFDLLVWLIGPVKTLFSFTDTLARDIEMEDTGAVALNWQSGTIGTVNVTMLSYPKNFESSITILGEKGTVKLSGNKLNIIESWNFSSPQDYDFEEGTEVEQEVSHSPFYRSVIEQINGNKSNTISGNEGLKSLELLVAAYKSSSKNEMVKLPLD